MDTKDLQHLFNYDEWANREILTVLKKSGTDRSRKLLAHILSAERLWLERIQQKPQSIAVWPDPSLERCEKEFDDLAAAWKRYLQSEADLERTVTYKNSKGEPWSSREEDILLHVITHSAYHRGQIAADLRAAGIQPAYTDFIHGVRQGLVE
jgi:uncharacterized damage-inducible protein DinB